VDLGYTHRVKEPGVLENLMARNAAELFGMKPKKTKIFNI
jgi:hypothetical protein